MNRVLGYYGKVNHRRLVLAFVLTAGMLTGFLGHTAPAAARGGVEVGTLTCRTLPETQVNWIVYSSISMRCVFDAPTGQEQYLADTGVQVGPDLSWLLATELRYVVLAASGNAHVGADALAGHYTSAGTSASVGVAAGASVLVGGGTQSVSLEPLGVETGSGLGVSAGLSYLVLRPEA